MAQVVETKGGQAGPLDHQPEDSTHLCFVHRPTDLIWEQPLGFAPAALEGFGPEPREMVTQDAGEIEAHVHDTFVVRFGVLDLPEALRRNASRPESQIEIR